jgi:hypothetical protein
MVVVSIAMVMVMITVAVMMVVAHMAIMFAISATFRIKRRFHMGKLSAQALQHGFNHVILADQNPAAFNLRRQMPIAEMPCKTRQPFWRFGGDLNQGLRRGLHQNDTAAFQQQPITLAERSGFFQIQQKGKTIFRDIALAAAKTVIEIERHPMAGGAFHPTASGQHLNGTGEYFSHLSKPQNMK